MDTRRTSVQVQAKSSGTWHARFPKDAATCAEDPAETSYRIFGDLGSDHPAYYIAPRWRVRNDIWKAHTVYLTRYEQKHGEPRQSGHHGILVTG